MTQGGPQISSALETRRSGAIGAPVLAIESSCDDTACAILDADGRVLAERVHTQREHDAFGGVVPEIAARAHLAALPGLVEATLRDAGLSAPDLGAIAASTGPGLIGGLIVGSGVGKGMALALGLPFIAVNHIEAHALSPRLPGVVQGGAPFPYLLLLVSGGHCQCIAVEGVGRYRKLGGTIDDAAGEAFDKVAKMLGLGWPGGPAIEALAREGRDDVHPLPRPLLGRPGCDFSFSGLKTAVAQRLAPYGAGALPRRDAADLAASFQTCVADVMVDRAAHALDLLPEATTLVVAGGVAANGAIRARLMALASERGLPFAAPPLRLCTDNAVMVGWAAIETMRAAAGLGRWPFDDTAVRPRPRWPLAEMAERFDVVR
ncbi:O-sialoglycoprotein endopeptidase [Ameyamaea chiangmaiensis NBRC 103196]|uniref:tRNA N6-adenosine threonylcarbamoyltransferase n=1 Tax=Ameyamaea chiangmaiensis TaxID=442969 RepID=A0A850PG67_9PROT|nr:tRNA (adenosine(37)-N6)-threonylcarbamoyltransferase complex transferase subunit TsaD [Ameyamaea chiangmaiensis]MBS4073865.1 tRNA (adenosine(37)-N6)-threonylcarbamoyltransferase complex transferase subunit TsaD [Ameyamaea chiangmaiensis]NVN41629.1 tRNA (adenosine(37)-N6)-threonylcarbamoyltransferase complex transferase subunit TsaD [Ameyamaea chiangmaiensis]GBQ68134.1 O-sialoglycoprotein endopeptidase [Ameyamaea chiangmaiensis NBRC 103196]